MGRVLVKLVVTARLLGGIAVSIFASLLRLPGVTAVRTRWQAASRFQRALLINMSISLLLTLVAQWGSTTPWLQPMSESALDWVLRQIADTTSSVKQGHSVPFVMIDIDEETQEAWGAPPFVDRHKLAVIMDKVLAARPAPKLVIVDVAMGRRKGVDEQPLRDALERHLRAPEMMPPLILIRDLHQPAKARDCLVPRPSDLDDLVEKARNRASWASPLFVLDEDRVVRRWRGFVPTTMGMLPGVELLAYGIVSGDMEAVKPPSPGNTDCAALHKDVTALSHRILFAISWNTGFRPTVDGHPILYKIPGHWLDDAKDEYVPDELGGKIVIVGASHSDSRDIHHTPLGSMPGSLIIANAVHSRLTFGEAHAPPLWETLLIQATLVTLIGALFARFNSFLGMVLSAAAVLAFLVPLGLALFDKGVWLNFAMPFFVVQIHQVIAELGERMRRTETKPQ